MAQELAAPCLGEFFTEAAQSRLRDDLSRDLDQDRQALDQVERVCQRELVKVALASE